MIGLGARRGQLDGTLRWWAWLALGQWRAAPGRAAVAILAVAIGVALALAVHLVNASALEEFRQAITTVNGSAHAQLQARSGSFDETLWAGLAGDPPPGLTALSPVIETDLVLAPAAAAAANLSDNRSPAPDASPETRPSAPRPRSLRLIALDPFAAAAVTPALLPVASTAGGADSPLFDPDAIFLSPAALAAVGASVGDALPVRVGLDVVPLRIAGTVPGAAPGQQIAVMDLGSAQWRLGWTGRLTRIDLRWAPGTDAAALQTAISARLNTPEVVWTTPDVAEQRMSNVSRAYRVNLNVLALVALFTGAFLVFATLALSVARQQGELALLGVLGASARQRLGAVLAQGVVLGTAGAALGVLLGIALGSAMLAVVGGDLGGGYFEGARPRLDPDPGVLALFFGLGLATGMAGALAPAWAASRQAPARALKGGSSEDTLAALTSRRWVPVLAVAGAVLLTLPPVGGLPLPAYVAIAAWLLAGIGCVPLGVRWAGQGLHAAAGRWLWRHPAAWLAVTRIAQAPGTVAAGLAGVVASFALACAMAIMVTSFRTSVADWLDSVLPADLYGRAAASAGLPPLDVAVQTAIASTPGVDRAEFMRAIDLSLDPARPAISLLIRDLDPSRASQSLPLTGAALAVPADAVGIWVSEPMLDLYGLRPGQRIELPIAAAHPREGQKIDGASPRFFVAGVWRDYARQHGALVMAAHDWHRLTGERGATDVAIWLRPDASAQTTIATLTRLNPALAALDWRDAQDIRALSLRIFDRSFAVTYALEAIAIVVGLFGVAAACAGDALARAREFGMLRHVGVARGAIVRQLALEATISVSIAVLWGGLIGAAIALVLIERVNPQSFHWSMQMHWPLGLLAGSGALLVAAAVLAALISARSALGGGPLAAVRQDW